MIIQVTGPARLRLDSYTILSHFQRVGRALAPIVPIVPFPSDLLRSAKCESLPEMTHFIDVLPTRLQEAKHFYSII